MGFYKKILEEANFKKSKAKQIERVAENRAARKAFANRCDEILNIEKK
jgi:hypothetical protein